MADESALARTREAATLYRRLIGARLRSQTEYRASFALRVLSALLVSCLDFVGIVFLFHRLPVIGSWTLPEVAVLYGIAGLAFGLCDGFIGHLDLLHRSIKDGSFDLVLIRPLGTLFQVLTGDVAFRKVGKALQALAVLVWGLSRAEITWTPSRVILLLVTIPSGFVVYGSIWVIGSSATFFVVDAMEVTNAFTYGGNFLCGYPVNLYGVWVRNLLAFATGLAFVAYFPTLGILGKSDPLGLPPTLQYGSPLVAVVAASMAGAIWRAAVRHYRSTGS